MLIRKVALVATVAALTIVATAAVASAGCYSFICMP